MIICYLGLGSNLGNRHKNLKAAVKKINSLKDTEVLKVSSIIESAPCGGPAGEGKFLNTALKLKTNLSAFGLLKKIKGIEKELGRKKTVRWGARIIDMDILLYDDQFINTKALKIPHPRIFEREFVIKPLLEII